MGRNLAGEGPTPASGGASASPPPAPDISLCAGGPLTIALGQTPREAARRLAEAARLGFPDAQLILAQLYLDGHGVERDTRAAYRWFSQAAAGGRVEALNMIGRCHELGWGVPADPALAAVWYRRAARRGHAWARFNLAGLLLDGQGVAQDARGALALYVQAARQGHAKAMTMIGRFCEEGWERRRNPAAAARWYRRGADGGDFRGHFNLALLLLAQGNAEEARGRLARAVEAATPVFCRDVADGLLRHPHEAIQALGRRCLARACETRDPADIARYDALLAGGVITFRAAPDPARSAALPAAFLAGGARMPRRSLLARLGSFWRGR
ncbi:tetratricopeptide repeat protein [Pseudochelatococcus sp. B33]